VGGQLLEDSFFITTGQQNTSCPDGIGEHNTTHFNMLATTLKLNILVNSKHIRNSFKERIRGPSGFDLVVKGRESEIRTIESSVLDPASQVRNVVLMNVYLDLGNPEGSEFWNGGYMSQGREMGS
jgi:hypothetical protein